jgi:hypothetical protein
MTNPRQRRPSAEALGSNAQAAGRLAHLGIDRIAILTTPMEYPRARATLAAVHSDEAFQAFHTNEARWSIPLRPMRPLGGPTTGAFGTAQIRDRIQLKGWPSDQRRVCIV